ncbi:MAG: hypothetical protein IJY67_10470, partial [Paludibacteraceae bacterium]|nr:hypothetical protein [Paludibacteraceae bacterium]
DFAKQKQDHYIKKRKLCSYVILSKNIHVLLSSCLKKRLTPIGLSLVRDFAKQKQDHYIKKRKLCSYVILSKNIHVLLSSCLKKD